MVQTQSYYPSNSLSILDWYAYVDIINDSVMYENNWPYPRFYYRSFFFIVLKTIQAITLQVPERFVSVSKILLWPASDWRLFVP